MSDNSRTDNAKPEEVMIFREKAKDTLTQSPASESLSDAQQRAVAADQAMIHANPQSDDNSVASNDSQSQITVDHVIIRPAPALLIIRLLGMGLAILLFLFLLAVFVDLISTIFPSFSPLFDNRFVMLFLGVIIYMAAGFVVYQQWAHRQYTIYANKIIIENGWLARHKRTLDIRQYGGAVVEQDLLGKALKYGTIRLLFNGAIGKAVGTPITDVSDPFENYELMMSLIRNQG